MSRLWNFDRNGNWNFDRNPNNVSDRTAREREYLSRLWNFDSNDGGKANSQSHLSKREEWLTLIWNYFLNGRDKVGWGQYIHPEQATQETRWTTHPKLSNGFLESMSLPCILECLNCECDGQRSAILVERTCAEHQLFLVHFEIGRDI